MDYHRSNGVDTRIVRIFNTYGPRMHPEDGRVVSNFVVQALRGESLTVYGGGHQTRSFCFVDDLIDGLIRMMNQDVHHGPVNLVNPEEITIRQLAERTNKASGSSSRIVDKPLPTDDPRKRRPDITLARELLGWEPTHSLDQGLKKTVDFFKELLAEGDSAS